MVRNSPPPPHQLPVGSPQQQQQRPRPRIAAMDSGPGPAAYYTSRGQLIRGNMIPPGGRIQLIPLEQGPSSSPRLVHHHPGD